MRVLIADDERDMAAALKAMLEHESYDVDVAYDGREALDRALANSYDCLVLDVMMPRMSGIEALAALRERGVAVPVLLLTAKSEPRDRIQGLDGGADDYLCKPFVMGELLARVRALTRRNASLVPTALCLGNTTIDRSTFELSCATATVRLGTKEFQLIELLMQQQGRVVSVERLMERVWGGDATCEPNVVKTYISYLCRKLEAVGSHLHIGMNADEGYILDVEA